MGSGFYGYCMCGKRNHATRREAKAEARRLKQKDGEQRTIYKHSHYYHVGRLPASVRKGKIDRRAVYSNGNREASGV